MGVLLRHMWERHSVTFLWFYKSLIKIFRKWNCQGQNGRVNKLSGLHKTNGTNVEIFPSQWYTKPKSIIYDKEKLWKGCWKTCKAQW